MKAAHPSHVMNDYTKIRSTQDIANRALALGAAVALSFGANTRVLRTWLRESQVQSSLTDSERRFVFGPKRHERATVQFTWRAEALLVLLWGIEKATDVPPPSEQCGTTALRTALPPFAKVSLPEFLATSKRRPEQELLELAAEVGDQHAIARQRLHGPNFNAEGPPIDIEIVQERHHAINWIIGYCGQSWDDVSADT